MRYFKCDTTKQEDRQMIIQNVALTEDEKKSDRQGKVLNAVASVLFLILFLVVFVGTMFLIVSSLPATQNTILFILKVLGTLISGFVALIVAISVGGFVSSPIYKKAQEKLVIHKRIYFDKALISLREYYGWTEPCIVTKCYDSSDKKFKNRDICIFLFDDELRIAADLKHGFSIRENDPGCYTFRADEIRLDETQDERFLMTQVKSGDLVFHLGRRAKGFIEKNFIFKKSDRTF